MGYQWDYNHREASALAKAIARDIFSSGHEQHDKVQRIAFMGGEWPDGETDLGGLCFDALARRIDQSLKQHMPRLSGESDR